MTGSNAPRYTELRPLGDVASGTNCSAYTSVTSIGLTVEPHAMSRFCPTITNGTPAKPLPIASKPPAARWIG